jgi:hypothetical protein
MNMLLNIAINVMMIVGPLYLIYNHHKIAIE